MEIALKLCAQYLGEKWSSAKSSDLSCVEINGKCNRLFHCKLRDSGTDELSEALVRFYGSEFSGQGNKFKLLSESEEAVIFHKISEHFSGPKLLAVFLGGRIEQFMPVESISAEVYESFHFASFLAKFIATIQCLEIPISKVARNLLLNVVNWSEVFENNRRQSKYRGDIYTNCFSCFNFKREIEWLKSIAPKVGRVVFSHCDLNNTNVVKRTDTNEYFVMDYEFSQYSFRWVDLSVYFCEILCNHFELGEEINLSYFPNEEVRKVFINAYLQEFKNKSKQFDRQVDSEESLLFETDFGSMFVFFQRMLFMLTHHSFEMNECQNLEIAKFHLQVYQHLKSIFKRKYKVKLCDESYL